MKIEDRLEQLEKRVRELEARPVYAPVYAPWYQPAPQPIWRVPTTPAEIWYRIEAEA